MRARSSTGWTGGEAKYDSGLQAHTYSRPAPKCSTLLPGSEIRCVHFVPGPVSTSVTLAAAHPRSALLLHHARYDAENRLSLVQQSGASQYYGYDAQNNRNFAWPGTLDSVGNVSGYTLNVYAPSGQKLCAYQITILMTGSPIPTPNLFFTLATSDRYFGGKRLAPQDRLSSKGDFYPYGESKGSNNPQDTWSYATYWRDSAGGLDYANNRYYSNVYGRFMTPDPYTNSGRLSDPQSWNRYSYTRGDPVNRHDPLGLLDSTTGDDPTGYCDPSIQSCDPLSGGGGGGLGGLPNEFQVNPVVAALDLLQSAGFVSAWTLVNSNIYMDVNWAGVISSLQAGGIALPAPTDANFWAELIALLSRANPLTATLALFLVQTGSSGHPPPDPSQCPDKAHFWNPDQAPHDGWTRAPGSNTWVSPDGRFTLRPDIGHEAPKGPHWELQRNGDPRKWECFPDGTMNAEGWNNQ